MKRAELDALLAALGPLVASLEPVAARWAVEAAAAVSDAAWAAEAPELARRLLRQALRGLKANQGPRGRRNARAKVARALAYIREAVDARFPKPPVTGRAAPAKTQRILEQRMHARGYAGLRTSEQVEWCARLGISVITRGGRLFAPRWVNSAHSLEELTDMKKRRPAGRIAVATMLSNRPSP